METYDIVFKGYRREEKVSTMPEYSGIYLAYRCAYNKANRTVSLRELIYIGQAQNLRTRLLQHKNDGDLDKELKDGEQICYAYAKVDADKLDIVENALIFAQQPRTNTNLKQSFDHRAAKFIVEGDCALLEYKDFEIS